MKIRLLIIATSLVLAGSIAMLDSPVLALARYECKGLASDTITLTPYHDGSVNLSFDKNVTIVGTTGFTHKGDVFAAEFHAGGGMLVYVFDTITKNGYEYFRTADQKFEAAKITCWGFQN
jgi:hypothetical protein